MLNLQGDVVKLVEHTRTGKVYNLATVANYTYNAWGEILSITDANGTAITDTTHISHINPLRYRGYYYDTETGFYYLQSRYYDPTTHRFINADSLASTGQGIVGTNMFAYCNNNPVMYPDPSGESIIDAIKEIIEEIKELIEEAKKSAYTGSGYIIDQDAPGIGNKDLGWTTVSHGGCGPIAAFNALIALGNPKSFDEVLSYYNDEASLILGGWGGMTHSEVADYFRSLGYVVIETDDTVRMDLHAQTADACILWYLFSTGDFPGFGGHFVQFNRVDGGYEAHNSAADSGITNFSYPSVYAYSSKRFYAIGIYIYYPWRSDIP